MNAKPAPVPARPASTVNLPNKTELEIGGGALALLALGGAGIAISRRRRRREEEQWSEHEAFSDQPAGSEQVTPRHDPIFDEQPAAAAAEPSAFAWGNSQSAAPASNDGSDRRPGETWVERAYRGPSPANPSVSLKNRLRRAAFFDKRERDVAAGNAEPVEPDAGLPERAVGEIRESESA
jgi:hypothetical protein